MKAWFSWLRTFFPKFKSTVIFQATRSLRRFTKDQPASSRLLSIHCLMLSGCMAAYSFNHQLFLIDWSHIYELVQQKSDKTSEMNSDTSWSNKSKVNQSIRLKPYVTRAKRPTSKSWKFLNLLPVLDPDRLYLELAFLMMFSWIWCHSLSVLHLSTQRERTPVRSDAGRQTAL